MCSDSYMIRLHYDMVIVYPVVWVYKQTYNDVADNELCSTNSVKIIKCV